MVHRALLREDFSLRNDFHPTRARLSFVPNPANIADAGVCARYSYGWNLELQSESMELLARPELSFRWG